MVIAHSNRREPDTESGPAFPDTIVLHCRRDEPPLHIAAASGGTYHIIACDAPACSRLIQETLRSPQAELLPRSGGLLSNLSVLENIVLPAVYHGRVARTQLAELVYDEFEGCGLTRPQAEALCAKAVPELDEFERRLVALVRCLLMQPAVLIMERIFEGLTTRDVERALRFCEYYRRGTTCGTVVLFDLAGMSFPEIAVDVRTEAQ